MSKGNQDELKLMNESGLMSKGIEEEKEKILSCWKEYMQEHKNQINTRSRYSNNNTRVNYIYNIRDYYREHLNGGKDDVNDKVTINNVITSLNDGDKDYNEEKERKIVHKEEEYKNVSVNKLDNIDIMRNVSDNEFKVPAGNTYNKISQNALSINKQDDSEQVNKSLKSQNRHISLTTSKPIVGTHDKTETIAVLGKDKNTFGKISDSSSNIRADPIKK